MKQPKLPVKKDNISLDQSFLDSKFPKTKYTNVLDLPFLENEIVEDFLFHQNSKDLREKLL